MTDFFAELSYTHLCSNYKLINEVVFQFSAIPKQTVLETVL
jgi:hypothetical protein